MPVWVYGIWRKTKLRVLWGWWLLWQSCSRCRQNQCGLWGRTVSGWDVMVCRQQWDAQRPPGTLVVPRDWMVLGNGNEALKYFSEMIYYPARKNTYKVQRISSYYSTKKKKITWKQHADKSIRIAKSQNTDHTQCWQESGAHSFRNSHSLLVSMQNGAATLEDSQSLHNWTYSCCAVQQSCFLMFAQRNWELISTWKPEHGCL